MARQAIAPVLSDPIQRLLGSLYRSDQLDALHLTLINLSDMVRDGDIELLLESEKPLASKLAFLKKVVDGMSSAEVRAVFEPPLAAKSLDFFRDTALSELITKARECAESFVVVKLTVALEFKEKDLRDMTAFLNEKIGRPVVLNLRVDTSIVGGAVIQFGSYLNDATIKTQLELFRHRWQRAVVEKE